jgi:hypothetical protein
VDIALQPFDGAAFEALKQRFPVRPRTMRRAAPASAEHACTLAHQGLVVVDYTHPSAVHTNAQARLRACRCMRPAARARG